MFPRGLMEVKFKVKKFHIPILLGAFALILLSVGSARGDSTVSVTNSGFYDHMIIQYKATAEVTSSPQAANLIAHGNIVYHIVDAAGNTPSVQCAPLLAAFPQDATSCNVLNRIPTDSGVTNQYNGGAWNLQIFHWKNGVTPTLLSKDDDIVAAANAGLGTIEVTPVLVRCPVIDFSSLR